MHSRDLNKTFIKLRLIKFSFKIQENFEDYT